MKQMLHSFFLHLALFLAFTTLPAWRISDWLVSNDQTTGNVWVTHEEMESLAATPPTVSLPWLAGHWWLLTSMVVVELCFKLSSVLPDFTYYIEYVQYEFGCVHDHWVSWNKAFFVPLVGDFFVVLGLGSCSSLVLVQYMYVSPFV